VEMSPAPGRITAVASTAPGSEMSRPSAHDGPVHDDRVRPARPGPARARALDRVALAAAGATVAVQIAHPLLAGGPLHAATAIAVLLFATASLSHAAARGGVPAAGLLLLVAGGIGLAVEAVGVTTGLPFGEYRYDDSLGPQLLGVPLLVPLAWTMAAYPCLLLGRRLAAAPDGRCRPAGVLLGAAALAAWDLFLDPQMVAEGHWTWTHPDPGLPGVPGVPLTNYAGWVLVALVMTAALDRALPPSGGSAGRTARPAAPALLLGWTWAGSTVADLVFFGRPAVAAYGAVVLGATVLPYLAALRADRQVSR